MTVLAGGAVLVCLAAYLYMAGQIRELDSKIAAAEQRQRELQAIKKQVDELEQKRATFQRKVDLINKLQAEQQGPVHLLDELSKALPDFVWLSNLDQAGNQIRLQGQSNSLTSVADFITALQAAGSDAYGCGKNNPLDRSMCWFPDVNLVSATEATNLVTFALQASFSNPEAILKQRQNATTPIPASESGGGGTSSRAALGGRRGAWLTTPIRSFRWVDSSESPSAIAALVGGLFWYFYWSDATIERDDKTTKLEALNKEIRALEVTAQKLGEFQREVAAPGEEARDAQEHPASGQGDARPDAQGPGPGRAVQPH